MKYLKSPGGTFHVLWFKGKREHLLPLSFSQVSVLTSSLLPVLKSFKKKLYKHKETRAIPQLKSQVFIRHVISHSPGRGKLQSWLGERKFVKVIPT